MRWTRGKVSADLEDRRATSGRGGSLRLGIGGALVLLVLSLVFKRNFFAMLDGGTAGPPADAATVARQNQQEQPAVEFVSFVLDDAQSTWDQILPRQYHHAKLVLFRDAIDSACGFAQAASGPFYCPADEKVYIDLGFYDELKNRFGAPGDFAQAYVLAHEIGHHVQKITGTEPQVRRAMERDPQNAGDYSVRLELQADCYAGVWAHSTGQRQILEQGDVEEGLNAAAAVGDDRQQRMSGRAVNPDAFTHGSSAQRVEWFRRGYESGRPQSCDTFR